MILVKLRLKRIRIKEIQIQALAGVNEHTKKDMIELLELYDELQFPGVEAKETKAEQDMKELLAKETKKVFAVRPALNPAEAIKKMSQDPRAVAMGRHYMKNEKIFKHKEQMARGFRKR